MLALNAEDGGDRRFILVSSTEATADQPEKNVCRDVCQKRLAKVITGYDYRTKDKLKSVEGLSGNFSYLKAVRIPPGRVVTRLIHAQVWTALQLMHLDRFDVTPPAGRLWQAGDDEESLVYLPRADEATLTALAKLTPGSRTTTLYAWQADLVAQHAPTGAVVRPIPQFLIERFGLKS